MKQFFIFASLLSSVAFANPVTLQCDVNRQMEGAQFQAKITLDVAADNTVSGQIAYTTIAAMNGDLGALAAPLDVTGTTAHYAAGDLYVNAVDSYQIHGTLPNKSEVEVGVIPAGNGFNAHLILDGEVEYDSHCVAQ